MIGHKNIRQRYAKQSSNISNKHSLHLKHDSENTKKVEVIHSELGNITKALTGLCLFVRDLRRMACAKI